MCMLTWEVTTITPMASGVFPASEPKVLMWKFEFPGARHLDMRNHPNDWGHFHCWTQRFGIRGVPCIGHPTCLKKIELSCKILSTLLRKLK